MVSFCIPIFANKQIKEKIERRKFCRFRKNSFMVTVYHIHCNLLDSYAVSFHFWYDNHITYNANQDLYWIRMFYTNNEASNLLLILDDGRVFYDRIEYRLHGTDMAKDITKRIV